MKRALLLGVAVASLGPLAACNMLTGADGLSSSNTSAVSDVGTGPATPAPTSSSGHDHLPMNDPMDGGGTALADGGGIDAADAGGLAVFTDDFSRPNSNLVGNGWLEKSSGAFPISGGASVQGPTGLYKNLFVARPTSENVTNVVVEVTVTVATTMSDPGLMARIQPDSAISNHFTAYSVYPDGPDDLFVDRDNGTNNVDIGHATISPSLAVGQPYRLSLEVTGANPVRLVGSIARLDGTVVASITVSDGSSDQITSAGSVGYGSSNSQGCRFDDYRRTTLP